MPDSKRNGSTLTHYFQSLALKIWRNRLAKRFFYGCLGIIICLCILVLNGAIAQDSVFSSHDLLTQGRLLYEAGHVSEASTVWQESAQISSEQQNFLNQAISLSYLAIAYQDLGKLDDAQQAIDTSLALFQSPSIQGTNSPEPSILSFHAQALTTRGTILFSMGQASLALETWETAQLLYRQVGDVGGVVGSQINQIQALQTLGFRHRAYQLSQDITHQIVQMADSGIKVIGLRSLGNIQRLIGQLEESKLTLEKGLRIAQQLGIDTEVITTQMSLAQTLIDLEDIDRSLSLYRDIAISAPSPLVRAEAQVNALSLLMQSEDWEGIQNHINHGFIPLDTLHPSQRSINVRVQHAAQLTHLYSSQSSLGDWELDPALINPGAIAAILVTAINQAQDLRDVRSESLALGHLGYLYEQTGQWQAAKTVTQEALDLANSINAEDIEYRWRWQIGRILQNENDREGAIAAYISATNILDRISGNLTASLQASQFSFRNNIEPIYRELLSLLLSPSQHNATPDQASLEQARQVIESLQLAELEQFFHSACFTIYSHSINQLDPKAAVIYPIVLPEQISILVALPNQNLELFSTPIKQTDAAASIHQFLQSVHPLFGQSHRLQLAQRLYSWLIQPAEEELAQHHIETLVFVLDGAFRHIPIAALHDGQHYLIENYGVAIAPTLQLLHDSRSVSEHSHLVLGGLSEERQGFDALPGVALEAEAISRQMRTHLLLNDNFTEQNLRRTLDREAPQILHLATHGQFSSDETKTFLLTWDEQINIEELRQITHSSNQPIDLLVLSACETAVGDDHALLGLAGLTVRSGVQSTLATLWSVNDESTAEFMAALYAALTQDDISKVEAVRQAQLNLINDPLTKDPFYWGAFVLIGNWL